MHLQRLIFVFLIPGCFILACNKRQVLEGEGIEASQWAYYPLEIGKYLEYQVDSIVFDFALSGGTFRDSSRVYFREIITDTLRDGTGALYYLIERYARPDYSSPWVFKNHLSASRTPMQAIRTEDNWRYLKLVFPMDKRSAWDGNLWIDETREIEFAGERMRPFSNWAYEVDSIDTPALVGAFSFDSTLLVTEADDTNVIERRYSRARYAKQVGLVWREQWILDSQYCNQFPSPPDCETRPWDLKAEKGYILRQVIVGYN